MRQRPQIDCAALTQIGDRFLEVGEFYSVFFRPATYPDFSQGCEAVLANVLKSHVLGEVVPRLMPLNEWEAMRFTKLDRYEFEGSLIGALLQGTCTTSVVADEQEARQVVRDILGNVLTSEGTAWAFRMDSPAWSALTNGATMSWSYFAYQTSRQLWWFVCFADYYQFRTTLIPAAASSPAGSRVSSLMWPSPDPDVLPG